MFNYNLPIKYYSMSLGYLLTFHHHEISLQHADYVVIASWPAYIDSYLLPILLSYSFFKIKVTIPIKVMVMMFNATFNNISFISWRSVLLVEEAKSTWRKLPTCRK